MNKASSREKLIENLLQFSTGELTWVEKLNASKRLPKVEKITDKMNKRWATGIVVIPAQIKVDEIMREFPAGKLITINEIRAVLARKHKTKIGCPITTGIFAWIAAHAAEEREQNGEKHITPYWCTLKTGGVLKEKYPGGVDAQKQRLEREGHIVVKKGKNYAALNCEKAMVQI
jgi:hypothetical protein